MESIVRKAILYLKKLYKNKKILDFSHDIYHLIRVAKNAIRIVKAENLEVKELELILASLFHDSGCFFVRKPKDIDKSIEIFLDFCEKYNLNKDIDVSLVVKCIKEHSFSKGFKSNTIEGRVLQDADRLDAIGSIGIIRWSYYNISYNVIKMFNPKVNYLDLWKYFWKNYNKENIRDTLINNFNLDDNKYAIDHFFLKLFLIPKYLNFEFSRKVAEKRLKVMKNFVWDLIMSRYKL